MHESINPALQEMQKVKFVAFWTLVIVPLVFDTFDSIPHLKAMNIHLDLKESSFVNTFCLILCLLEKCYFSW